MRIVSVGLVLALCASAKANPVDAFGFGARAQAMGGAQAAAARDGGANYYNPAALALANDIRIEVGYQAALPRLSLGAGVQDVDSSHGINAAISAPGSLAHTRVAFGVGVFLPDERVTRVRTLPGGRPRWILYDNRPQRIFIASNIAIRLTDSLYVGGGLAYMSQSDGSVDLTGRLGYPNTDDSTLGLDINVSLLSIRYPQAGILWRARPWLDIGVTYRGKFVLSLDQGFALHGDLGPANQPIVRDAFFKLTAHALDLFQPTQVAAGIAAQLSSRFLLSFDLIYQRWSDFDNPAAKIDISYDLGQFNPLVNIPPPVPLEPAYFHDTFVTRIGMEVVAKSTRHTTWRIRAGYAYEPSPAPEQRGETNFVDNDKHTFSAGVGVSIAQVSQVLLKPFDIDFFVATTVLPSRDHRKLSPVDPIGDYESSGYVVQAGVMTEWRF